jgi:hypothetical protein
MVRLEFDRFDGIKCFFEKALNDNNCSTVILNDGTSINYYSAVLYQYIDKYNETEILDIVRQYNSTSVRYFMDILHYGFVDLEDNGYLIHSEGNALVELFDNLGLSHLSQIIEKRIENVMNSIFVNYKACFVALESQYNVKIFNDESKNYVNLTSSFDGLKICKGNWYEDNCNSCDMLCLIDCCVLDKMESYFEQPMFDDFIELLIGNMHNDIFKLCLNRANDLNYIHHYEDYKGRKRMEMQSISIVHQLKKQYLTWAIKNFNHDLIKREYFETVCEFIDDLFHGFSKNLSNQIINILKIDLESLGYFFEQDNLKEILIKYIQKATCELSYDELCQTLYRIIKLKDTNPTLFRDLDCLKKIRDFDGNLVIAMMLAYNNESFDLNNVKEFASHIIDKPYQGLYLDITRSDKMKRIYINLHKTYRCNTTRLQVHLKQEEENIFRSQLDGSGSFVKRAVK